MIDCGFIKGDKWFRYRAAAIIVEDGYVLFAGNERDDFFYSVGGGVHAGETAQEAVVREVFEETGVHYEVDRLAVIHENFFDGKSLLEGMCCHEICFYFLMKERRTRDLNCKSKTLGGVREYMQWLPIEDLEKYRAYPVFLKDYLRTEHEGIVHIISDERKVGAKEGV